MPKQRLGAFCLIIIALATATPLLLSSRNNSLGSASPPSLAVDLYRARRLVYPRVSIQQQYQQCPPENGPGIVKGYDCFQSADDLRQLRRILKSHSADGNTRENTDKQMDLLVQLGYARGDDLIKVAKILKTRALTSQQPDPWIDVSAAFYLAATLEDLPEMLSPALDAADRALQFDPSNPSAAFNRALAFEALALRAEAKEAWRTFLSLEPEHSPWVEEAHQHLATLSRDTKIQSWQRSAHGLKHPLASDQARGLIGQFGSQVRDWIEFELLTEWAELWLQNDFLRADTIFQTARVAAKEIDLELHEPQPAQELSNLEEAIKTSNPHLTVLATGLIKLRKAREEYNKGNYQSTLKLLPESETKAQNLLPTLALWARYYRAASLDQQGFKEAAYDILEALIEDTRTRSFPSILARAQTTQGRIMNNLGRPEQAIPLLTDAIATLDLVKDDEGSGWARVILGDSYRLIGDYRSSWEFYYVALHQITSLGLPLRELAAFNGMADFLFGMGDLRLSLYYQSAAVSIAPQLQNPSFYADVLLWRSLLLARLGDSRASIADLQNAQHEAAKILDIQRVNRFNADFGLCKGIGILDHDPASAVRILGPALRYFQTTKHWSRMLLTLEARASAYGLLGKKESRLNDLQQARDLYESVGREIRQDGLRISFAERIESTFDQLLRISLDEKCDPEVTFSIAEQERSLNTPTAESQLTRAEAVSIGTIRSALPPRTALIEYATLSDRLLVWLITGDRISLHTVPVAKPKLEQEVKRLREQMASKGSQWEAASASLGRLILEPIEDELYQLQADSLIIIPDEQLFDIPFAAVKLPHSGDFLVEHYALAINLSANSFTRAAQRQRHGPAKKPLQALIVANPVINGAIWQHLPNLKTALAEGMSAQKHFPGKARLLTGLDATAPNVLKSLKGTSWLHYAGHGVNLPRKPLESYLLFTPSPSHSGRVTAKDLSEWNLVNLQGVILSTCGSAAQAEDSRPGTVNLARPFLASGVPLVIGSLWDLDDIESHPFFELFYTNFAKHGSAFKAFHKAQLSMLHNPPQPSLGEWFTLELLGAPDVTFENERNLH